MIHFFHPQFWFCAIFPFLLFYNKVFIKLSKLDQPHLRHCCLITSSLGDVTPALSRRTERWRHFLATLIQGPVASLNWCTHWAVTHGRHFAFDLLTCNDDVWLPSQVGICSNQGSQRESKIPRISQLWVWYLSVNDVTHRLSRQPNHVMKPSADQTGDVIDSEVSVTLPCDVRCGSKQSSRDLERLSRVDVMAYLSSSSSITSSVGMGQH